MSDDAPSLTPLSADVSRRRLGFVAVVAVALILWLVSHPYRGVWHDGRIYGLLAAHWGNPAAFSEDIFFRFGSQGALSAFTPIYGYMVATLGLDWAARLVVSSGALIWVVAAAALARNTLGYGFASILATTLAAVTAVNYSPSGAVFVLNENFATARSWGVSFGLASIAAFTWSHHSGRALAWMLGLLAVAIHPLMGIWPLALLALVSVPLRVAAVLVCSSIVVAVTIGLADLPFAPFRIMSGEWGAFVLHEVPALVFRGPEASNHLQYLAAMGALVGGLGLGRSEFRRLYACTLLLAGGALGLTVISSYWLPVEILLQGQAWRAFWLVQLLAVVAVLDLLQSAWRSEPRLRSAIVGLIVVLVADQRMWMPACAFLAILSLAPTLRRHLLAVVTLKPRWTAWGAGALAVLVLPDVIAEWDLLGRAALVSDWSGPAWLLGLMTGGTWHLALLVALCSEGLFNLRGLPFVRGAVIGAFLVWALIGWDQRSPARRDTEACFVSNACAPHAFRAQIKPGDTVYWPNREEEIWFLLRAASYYGWIQSTGVVFSQDKFLEWRRRGNWVRASTDPIFACGDPEVDWIVLAEPFTDRTPRVSADGSHLYHCRDLDASSGRVR